MVTKRVLRRARILLDDPAHWTQGANARDAKGNEIDEADRGATCFCIIGALYRSARGDQIAAENAVDKLMSVMPEAGPEADATVVSSYNDSHTHSEVLELLDKAIGWA